MTTRNDVQVEVTADLIREEGMNISLIRKANVRTESFGVAKGVETVLDPVRRFFAGTRTDEFVVATATGRTVDGSFVLIGMPGDDIKAGDEFEVFGDRFKVSKVHRDKRFQVKAWCEIA